MNLVFIDCETRSELDLKKVGMDRYSHDCQLLMIGYALDDAEPDLWVPSVIPKAPDLVTLIKDPTITKVAWNAGFERSVLRNQLGIDTPITEWIDPSVYARYLGLPSTLALVSDYLGLCDEGKDKEGRRLIHKFSKTYKSRKSGQYRLRNWNDKPHVRDWQLFQDYCRQDVRAERAVYRKLAPAFTPPDFERALWELDQLINERGLPINLERIHQAQEIVRDERARLGRDLNRITGLRNANSLGQLLPWLRRRGYQYTSIDREHVRKALEPCLP